MKGSIAGFIVVASLVSAAHAYAQEIAAGPGALEVTIIPGGYAFFTSKDSSPEFGNYQLGAAAAYNVTRIIGVEGEVGGSIGVTQDLSDAFGEQKTPNMLSYSGNVLAHVPGHSVVPYATGGIGGLSLFKRDALGITGTETYFTGNVGGGVKWFAPNGRWGLRGDYRFLMVAGKDESSAFFGPANRYANRVYGAVIINAIR